jgi:hypothetical protein
MKSLTTYGAASDFGKDPFGGKGYISHHIPGQKITWQMEDENGNIAQCTQTNAAGLFEANEVARKESAGQRWGDGAIIGSIDLPTYYRKTQPAQLAGDQAYIKRFWNDSENLQYRTREGKI